MPDIDDRSLPPREPKERLARLFLKLLDQQPKKILDIGCAHGRYVSFYAREFGAEGIGIDVDENAITVARELVEDTSVCFMVADGTNLPPEITEQRFDLILLVGSRVSDYGLFSPEKVMKNIDSYLSLLTDDGTLVLKENTDFSGRIEPTIGWHFKASEEIDELLLRGGKIFYFWGLSRSNSMFTTMPIIRGAASFLVKHICRILSRQCSFVITMRRLPEN